MFDKSPQLKTARTYGKVIIIAVIRRAARHRFFQNRSPDNPFVYDIWIPIVQTIKRIFSTYNRSLGGMEVCLNILGAHLDIRNVGVEFTEYEGI